MSSPIVITGAGHALLSRGARTAHEDAASDPTPFLRVRKSRKYMGLQDELAVVAAGRALRRAQLPSALGRSVALFVAVGYIPFRTEDADPVLAGSLDERGEFSLRRFGEDGYTRANPLLTFRCLPNMPAYHVSVNFDVQGPYLVTYPGPAQLYAALEDAVSTLDEARAELALVGAVAHQRNFLVEHHFSRLRPRVPPEALRDVGAMLVVETEAHAVARGAPILARLEAMSTSYQPPDVLEADVTPRETIEGVAVPEGDLGPALLPTALSMAGGSGGVLRHALESRDGVSARSEWRLS